MSEELFLLPGERDRLFEVTVRFEDGSEDIRTKIRAVTAFQARHRALARHNLLWSDGGFIETVRECFG